MAEMKLSVGCGEEEPGNRQSIRWPGHGHDLVAEGDEVRQVAREHIPLPSLRGPGLPNRW